MIQEGDKIDMWFNHEARVLKVLPYTGRYPQWFTCVLRVTSNTPRGWMEVAYNDR